MSAIRIGVVGTGAWGRHHVRVIRSVPGARLVRVADLDEERLGALRREHPGLETSTDAGSVLEAPDLDAVLVCTPARTHGDVALRALAAGKHVLVEKPLAMDSRRAATLVRRAKSRGVVLMVGHLLLYHPAVLYLHRLVQRGSLGDVRYFVSRRVNLGQVRSDENALWSLAPHDISLMTFLAGEPPCEVAAQGAAWLRPGVEDLVFLHLRWRDGRRGQIHVSWLDPHKERILTVVGTKKMAVFNDMEPAEKIRIHDRGVEPPTENVGAQEALSIRFGDVLVPRIPSAEPLREELLQFVRSIRKGGSPRSDGDEGLAVVRVLEAASKSLAERGRMVPVPGTRRRHGVKGGSRGR